jgi:hypothetical protein
MKRIMFIPLILIMLLVIIGCNEEKTGFESYNKPPYKSYYPLTIGNRWVYNIEYSDSLGKRQEIQTAMKISSKLSLKYQDNEIYSILTREGQEDWIDNGEALSVSPAGLLDMKVKNGAVDHYYLSLPYHPNQGDIWYSLGFRFEVIDTNANLTTKAGSFKDVLVLEGHTIEGDNNCFLFYYALNCGQVKVLHYTMGVLVFDKELISYHPGSTQGMKPLIFFSFLSL